MKRTVAGALAVAAVVLSPSAVCAGPQEDTAAMAMMGTMFGAIINATRPPPPPPVVVVQPYPVYVPSYAPLCWWEQRLVPTDYGPAPQTVRVCQ